MYQFSDFDWVEYKKAQRKYHLQLLARAYSKSISYEPDRFFSRAKRMMKNEK